MSFAILPITSALFVELEPDIIAIPPCESADAEPDPMITILSLTFRFVVLIVVVVPFTVRSLPIVS